MSVTVRDQMARAMADTFDEWLFRMHGVTSSCRHEPEGEALADAALSVLAGQVEGIARVIADNGSAPGVIYPSDLDAAHAVVDWLTGRTA